MSATPFVAASLAESLSHFAHIRPQATALITVDARGDTTYSYLDLQQRAQALAARLQRSGGVGERALLLMDSGVDYVTAFFACLYSGVVAVPVFPPESVREQHLQRLRGIAEDAEAKWILTSSEVATTLQQAGVRLSAAKVVAVDQADVQQAGRYQHWQPQQGDLAFLQYTSGSTSAPKGVMVSHDNLLANEVAMYRQLQVQDDDVFVSWLPLYHDMGLIGGLLLPVFSGRPLVLMSPKFFLERPSRWLEAVARHRGTVSGGPDFAYRLCVDRVRRSQLQGLDLSHWRVAFSGAEPVRAATLQDFVSHLDGTGFNPQSLMPSYGLAEATLMVSTRAARQGLLTLPFATEALARGQAQAVPTQVNASVQVSCGTVVADHQLAIVDPSTLAEREPDQVGEIWFSGPSVAEGYWRNAEATAASFVDWQGRRWLRTGDLGFIHNQQLYISGRCKDLIIVRGQNLYPQDIEAAIEAELDWVRKGRVAAFAVTLDEHGQRREGIGLALEVSRSVQKLTAPGALVQALDEVVSRIWMEPLAVVVLLQPGALPKTSSGKLQRSACRHGWQESSLDAYAIYQQGQLRHLNHSVTTDSPSRSEGQTQGGISPRGEVEMALAQLWENVLQDDEHRPLLLTRDASFFALGGNSLKAVALCSQIAERWQVSLSAREVFEFHRLDQMAAQIEQRQQAEPALQPVALVDRQQPLPTSAAQQSLWLTWKLDPDSAAYNMVGVIDLQGVLDGFALQQALRYLCSRHEPLRSVFREEQGPLRQQLLSLEDEQVRALWQPQRLSLLGQADVTAAAAAQVQQWGRQPLALDQAPAVRTGLLQLAEDHHQLVLVIHHILADGASVQALFNDLGLAYQCYAQGQTPAQPALTVQFADLVQWQQQQLAGCDSEGRSLAQRQAAYWQQRLAGPQPARPLAADFSVPSQRSEQGLRYHHLLPAGLSATLQALARQQQSSVFVLLQAAFTLLLSRLSGQCDIRLGVPSALRHYPHSTELVGYLTHVAVVRQQPRPGQCVASWLQQVSDELRQAQQHLDLSFEQMVEAVAPERQAGVNPLFQIKMTEQQPLPRAGFGGVQFALQEHFTGLVHFDLSLDICQQRNGIELTFTYASDLFRPATIALLGRQLEALLEQLALRQDQPLAQLQLAEPLSLQSGPGSELPPQEGGFVPVTERWQQAWAQIDDGRPVLLDGECCWSLAGVQQQVAVLSQRLLQHGVQPEQRVAVLAGRSPQAVMAMLAILQVGAVWVPLDPALPAARLAYQLQDCGAVLLLVAETEEDTGQADWAAAVPRLALTVSGDTGNVPALTRGTLHPQQAAYVIYTSGSTGQPKGVVITHGALANYVQAVLARLALPNDATTMMMVSTPAADLGHTVLFGALCSGRTLSLPPQPVVTDTHALLAYLQRHPADVLKIVPSHLAALLHAAEQDAAQLLPRHSLISGGESLSAALAAQVRALAPQCQLVNHYGPTETTVGVLTHILPAGMTPGSEPAIGSPLQGCFACILDADLQPLPLGCAGELYLGGAGVARGYLQRPALTAERFIPDPWHAGQRLYRSGDRARLTEDGSLHYLGRADDQVKVRGYRLELAEVAAQLMSLDGVRQAEVLALQDEGRTQLLAFVVADRGRTLQPAALLSQLAAILPDYMLPSQLLLLPALPLTANGKVDRQGLLNYFRQLPAPSVAPAASADAAEQPQGEVECLLAMIWGEVLNQPRVGRRDNFFALGGDSILSLQIVARCRKAGWKLTPKQLFDSGDIATLAPLLAPLTEAGAAPARTASPFAGKTGRGSPFARKASAPAVAATAVSQSVASQPVVDSLPLLPLQARFFTLPVSQRQHWNQALLLRPVTAQGLDAELLQQALVALVTLHPVLATRFKRDRAGQWQQHLAPLASASQGLLWQREACSSEELTPLCDQAQRSLDLQHGPLWRAVLIDLPEGEQRLLLVIHHLLVDGVSWRILLEDLQQAYQVLAQGQTVALPAASTPWQYADLLHQQLTGEALQAELRYWQQLADSVASQQLRPAAVASTLAGQRHLQLTLDQHSSRQLLTRCVSHFAAQINDLLLAAVARAWQQWQGQALLVEVESHGREWPADWPLPAVTVPDLSRSVGWFTAIYPLLLGDDGRADASWHQRIRTVQQQRQAVPAQGLGFGLLRWLGTAEQQQALAALPQAALLFNYLGQFHFGQSGAEQGEPGWQLACEGSGDSRDPAARASHGLIIDAQVVDGQFSFSLRYQPDLYPADQMAGFAAVLQQALLALVAEAQQPGPLDLTLAGLTTAQLQQLDWPAAVHREGKPLGNLADIYPLSPMQQGMVFHSLYQPDGSAYLNQIRFDLQGLDAERFIAAWQATVDQHPVLRSAVVQGPDGTPLQWVAKQLPLPLRYEQLNVLQQRWGKQALTQLAAEELQQGIDIPRPPLLKLALVAREVSGDYHLIVTLHHLITDGWSTSLLFAEVLRRYQQGADYQPAETASYRDYIGWLQAQDRTLSLDWWQQQLSVLEQPAYLASAVGNPAAGNEQAPVTLTVPVTATRSEALVQFARSQQVTLNTLLQGAWLLLLQRYCGQRQVCTGVTVAGRPAELAGVEAMPGLFINTLPLLAEIRPEQPVGDWLRQLQQHNLAAREHEHTPLFDLQAAWGQQHEHNRQGLFDTLLVFENYPVDKALQRLAGELAISNLSRREQTNYPLLLVVHQQPEGLLCELSYQPGVFRPDVVERIGQHLLQLLDELQQPARPLAQIELLPAAERQQVQHISTQPRDRLALAPADYPAARPVFQLFEQQAAQHPQREALTLVCGEAESGYRSLSYAELNQRANRLAHALLAAGVQPDDCVGVMAERSLEMVLALLAVQKAGAAYVPLDPAYPAERLQSMVAQSGVRLVLSLTAFVPQAQALQQHSGAAVMCLDLQQADVSAMPVFNPDLPVQPQQLAYVIFTSGSTGTPKGVGNQHGALFNRLFWMQQRYALQADDVVLQKTPYSFDVSVWEFFWPLLSGARLLLAEPGVQADPARLRQLIREQGVTTLHFVPSMLDAFLAQQHDQPAELAADCSRLRRLICSGEALALSTQQQLLNLLPQLELHNLYGPTEAAIDVTAWQCRDEPGRTQVPIGAPIANVSCWVLDADLNPLPPGVPGELYLGGVGLARGYIGRADLSAERFIPDPFSVGGRLYRTGDLVRWREDGVLDYLGRLDHQLKLRGQRIELGEIEARLRAVAGVREAVVCARDSGAGVQLVAYWSGSQLDSEQLRSALAAQLPDYMLPTAWVTLPRLPLNANGKVDRRALPAPQLSTARAEPPQSASEIALAQIWREVLQQPQIGRHDQFFALGGHSLALIQVQSRIRQQLGLEISLQSLYQLGELAALAAELDRLAEQQPQQQHDELDAMSALLDALEND
ncbi:amino acid adenylation domain-containing protein [Pokkaliibacter sp. MBI-7]|uniref:non-ribosomal peptide synthetase n=1 Tax=Pokkaliibacter sp. MBI-7 TaxID=3040600 RepID=UPI002448E8C2|nr:non-ribosomal peptide synthetase [Pokkaliibacter sp. MBI-7]MDH2433776.1 amino acid adenylation domain-containing protein [Pokkaliibacter sp. MBI-7]